MKQHEVESLSKALGNKFDLDFEGILDPASAGATAFFHPREAPKTAGFSIVLSQSWKRLAVDFHPGTYAQELISSMENAAVENRSQFSAMAKAISDEGGSLSFSINDASQNPYNPESWLAGWKKINLSLKTKPLDLGNDAAQDFSEILKWVELFTAIVLSLAPLETMEDELAEHTAPSSEGLLKRVMVNRYERDRVNRSICLHFHGTRCKVCGLSFAAEYGKIGEGFIHVHHLVPVSKMQENYKFDPIKDLVPVCPNCHAMLHRREPPYTPEELIELVTLKKR